MFPAFQPTHMLTPAPDERHTARVAEVFSYFLLLFIVTSVGRSLLSVPAVSLLPEDGMIDRSAARVLISLFATTVTVVCVLLWCRLGERRSFASLGFIRRGAVSEYAVGILFGILLFGGAVGLCLLTGTATVTVADEMPSLWLLLLFLVGFLVQGMSEELLCRSFLMVSLSRRWPLWGCATANAAIFALLHIGNPGVTVIALFNIFLFGLFASLLTLRRGSIWMVAALHSLWNFSQGNLFGVPVSGLTGMPSPLATTLTPEGTWWQVLVNGGAFGLEGGLATTAVLGLGLFAVCLTRTKKSEVTG